MQKIRQYENKGCCSGFTLVELIIVVVILSIAALIAVPMVSNAADIQVRAAANQIAAHLDYAKSMAITHQQSYSIVFDLANESYDIRVTSTNTIVKNPLISSRNFVVDFSTDGRLSRVNIASANFDSDSSYTVTFDYLGSPHSGTSLPNYLNDGLITLQDEQTGNFKLYVIIEPVTGYVTIDDTPPTP